LKLFYVMWEILKQFRLRKAAYSTSRSAILASAVGSEFERNLNSLLQAALTELVGMTRISGGRFKVLYHGFDSVEVF
jgi:hypothetical protein